MQVGGSCLDHWVTFCFISKCALFLKLVTPHAKENAGLLGDASQAFKNRGFAKVRSYLRPAGGCLLGVVWVRGGKSQEESTNLFWDLKEAGETVCEGF